VKNSTPHILIIEDEPDISELLENNLETAEYNKGRKK
jgi:DNA-binding response OmpR family regulator